MTVGSLFGFQPHPMPPLDEKEFHSYQRERVKLYQDRMFVSLRTIGLPQPIPTLTPQVRVVRKVKKKSNSSVKKNGESGNRNRSK